MKNTLSISISLLCFFMINKAHALNNEDNVELINQRTTIVVNKDKVIRKHQFEICIYNREGEEFTEIEIPFSKMIKVSNINGYIKSSDGKIVKKLKRNQISKRSAISSISLFEDHYLYSFTLKHNQYPYYIHYEYEEEENQFLFVSYWIPALKSNIKTKQASLKIQIPADYKIKYHQQSIDSFSIDSIDGNYLYTWETSHKKKLKAEQYSPPIDNFLPSVIMIPQSFKYEINGSLASWKAFGLWQYNLINNIQSLPESEVLKIKNLVSGTNDTLSVVKKLYKFLQDETRYINITLKTGGLKPYPATYVAHNRYGDCKALSNYFKSVLNSVGIKSYYTKIYAGDVIRPINMAFPSQQSNHVILCVPTQNDTLWLDCTSDCPMNYVGTFIQNREAFVIDGENSYFSKTPALSSNQVLNERTIKFDISANGETEVEFNKVFRGPQFEALHNILYSYNTEVKDQIIRDNIEYGFELTKINNLEFHRDSTSIKLDYTARSNKVVERYGDDMIINIIGFTFPRIESPSERNLPVQINYPKSYQDSLIFKLPANYNLISLPQNVTIQEKYGYYSISFFRDEQHLLVTKEFRMNSGYYSNNEYPEFFRFLKTTINSDRSQYFTLKKTQ